MHSYMLIYTVPIRSPAGNESRCCSTLIAIALSRSVVYTSRRNFPEMNIITAVELVNAVRADSILYNSKVDRRKYISRHPAVMCAKCETGHRPLHCLSPSKRCLAIFAVDIAVTLSNASQVLLSLACYLFFNYYCNPGVPDYCTLYKRWRTQVKWCIIRGILQPTSLMCTYSDRDDGDGDDRWRIGRM